MSPAKRALFALAPALLLLSLGELGARALDAPECQAITPNAKGWDTMVADPVLLWKLEPDRLFESPNGTTTTNSLGFRTPHMPGPRVQGERRVVLVGDSSVFGWGQPDGQTYAEQLERMLDAAFVPRVKVINMGVPGYSTEQTLVMMEQVGWSYSPDLLVVHSIFSDSNIDAFQDRAAMALSNPEPSALHSSRLYCALHQPWAEHQAGLNQQSQRVLMPGVAVDPEQVAALEGLDRILELSRVPLDDYVENLQALRQGAQAHGGQMLVAPLAQEWDVGRWTAAMPKPPQGAVLPWHAYQDAQAEWAQERGVSRLFLPQVFAQSEVDADRLFIDHIHPSVVGGWVMAKALTEHLYEHPELIGLSAQDRAPGWTAPPAPAWEPPRMGPPKGQGGGPGPPGPPVNQPSGQGPRGPRGPGPVGPPNPQQPSRQ